jgi:hypothetical protein
MESNGGLWPFFLGLSENQRTAGNSCESCQMARGSQSGHSVPISVKCVLESIRHVTWQEPNVCGSDNKREPVCAYEASMYFLTARYKTYQEQQYEPNLWEVVG